MSAVAFAMAASCAVPTIDSIPQAPLEECVYNGGNTEFSVWAPTAEAAQVKLYRSASDTLAFKTVDLKLNSDGLWKAVVKEDLKGAFYAFQVKHAGKWLEETAGIVDDFDFGDDSSKDDYMDDEDDDDDDDDFEILDDDDDSDDDDEEDEGNDSDDDF